MAHCVADETLRCHVSNLVCRIRLETRETRGDMMSVSSPVSRIGIPSRHLVHRDSTRRVPKRVVAAAGSSGDDNEGGIWNVLGGSASKSQDEALEQDGWVSYDPEPDPSSDGDWETDSRGKVVYYARGFYYDAVRESDIGERVTCEVGLVSKRVKRTFFLNKTLANGESDIVEVTMERPLGIVFEPDTEGRVRVADFVEGSRAGRAAAVASLSPVGAQAARRGDVLRAFTSSTISFGPRAQLLGDLSGSKRAVVLFGADGQSWVKTISALKSGLVADGPVTLLLERDRDPERAKAWTPEELPKDDPRVPGKPQGAKVTGGSPKTSGKTSGTRRTVDDESNVPDAINYAFLTAGISFVLLILAGFNP